MVTLGATASRYLLCAITSKAGTVLIFARRAIQKRIEELRETLDQSSVDDLVARLSRIGKDRLAAMWEVVVLSGLAKIGILEHELPLRSGRRPDIRFSNPEVRFTADITSVSDSGLDERNPFQELMRLISEAKTKLGLPPGGLDLRVLSADVVSSKGRRRVLRLPPKNKLTEFVRVEIRPILRAQLAEGLSPLSLLIDDDGVGIEITINPAGSDFTTGSYAPYSSPTIKDQNPLFNALKSKAAQLRDAQGLKGVIVVDGDCAALSTDRVGPDAFSPNAIAREFLRQYSSVDFVLMIAVREVFGSVMPLRYVSSLYPILVMRENDRAYRQLQAVFSQMLGSFPTPINSAVNGAIQATENGYGFGNHGGYSVHGSRIRVSAREMMEVLAGVTTFDDSGTLSLNKDCAGEKSDLTKAFLAELMMGRLPSKMSVIETSDDENDKWIEFEFDRPDPAISPFR